MCYFNYVISVFTSVAIGSCHRLVPVNTYTFQKHIAAAAESATKELACKGFLRPCKDLV